MRRSFLKGNAMKRVYETAHAVKKSIPKGKTITLIGGHFDLLHVAHLRLLEHAKKLEDYLVVCVLSDANTQIRKGATRPIIAEGYRATLVAALRCVDRVFVSDIDTSHQDTLSALQPSSLVFGIEDTDRWRTKSERREQFIRSLYPNINILYLDRFPDPTISTSGIIQKIIDS